jgi:hypothetical protein
MKQERNTLKERKGTRGMAFNDGGPAYPITEPLNGAMSNTFQDVSPGMSLRDYFAAAAMPHCCALIRKAAEKRIGELMRGAPAVEDDDRTFQQMVAKDAYLIADAMLAERAKAGAPHQ